MFRAFREIYQKSVVAVVVQNLLEKNQANGLFDIDPSALSNRLVSEIWAEEGDALSGRKGPKPHKLTVAALALSHGMDVFDRNDDEYTSSFLALGNIIMHIQQNRFRYSFNGIDLNIIDSTSRAVMLAQYEINGYSNIDIEWARFEREGLA